MNSEREQLGSRMGFILLSAACAIGCGNVWKFPWLTGQQGGGAFVVVYLLFLVLIGLPIMTMEFSLGRASQKSPVHIYQVLAPQGSKWYLHGYAALIGNVVLMMFYTVVTGWMLYYVYATMTGKLAGLSPQQVGAHFGGLLGNPTTLWIFMAIVVVAGFLVVSFSLKGGLERVNNVVMLTLFVLMIVLAGHALTMDGAAKGMSFYLKPDFSKINSGTIVAAMNQAFFTLSLGIGSMAIFGSYIDKSRSLLGESVNVITLDTFVAIMAGIIIFPACFTYDVAPGAGPGLLFVTLPNVFNHMAGGQFWGALFFVFMTFAAFSTVLAVFENIMACVRDITGWDRRKSALILCVAMLVLATPCVLGFNAWASFEPMGKGTCVLDLEDFIVSNCLLPLGGLIFVLFCTQKNGFGWDKFVAEANTGTGLKMRNWARFYCTYILPLIILVIFFAGLMPFFK